MDNGSAEATCKFYVTPTTMVLIDRGDSLALHKELPRAQGPKITVDEKSE